MKSLRERASEVIRKKGYRGFVEQFFRFIIWKWQIALKRLYWKIVIDRSYTISTLRRLEIRNLDHLVDFAFTWNHRIIEPVQVRYEILELLKTLDKMNPKALLEIGTENGGTLFLFSRVASSDAIIISVDKPTGFFGMGYDKWRTSLYRSFTSKGQQLHLVQKDSHNISTLEEVKVILRGRKIDFLFLDADHTYEGVRRDFEMYSPLVDKNGIIAFHDILVNPQEPNIETHRFWNETKNNYAHIEIIENRNQGLMGIGFIKI